MVALLIVIYIVFISLGLPDSLFGVSWPVVHTEFGIAESFASVYSIIVGFCTGGVSFIAGTLLRKFGTAKVTFFSTLLTAAGLLGMSFAPNIIVMMIFAVILGYGAGAIDTGLNNFVSLHYKSQHMNWLHCFWGVGVTTSPMIMSLFLTGETGAWRNGYKVVAFLQLSIAVIVLFFLKRWQSVEKSCTAAEEETSDAGKFTDILKIRGVLTSVLSQGLYCGMEFTLGTWGATYAVNSFGLSPDVAAKWVSLYYGGIMLGRMISGFVAMKVSDKMLIRGGIGMSFLGILFLALPIGSASLIGLLLLGIGFGPVFPSILHSVPERFGAKYSADITGYHMGGAYGIGFAIQLAFGYIASATTFKITPFVLIIICACLFGVNELTEKLVRGNKKS
ncbi:MAG: MFS transporter [Ruminococcaceae bacterium]|nr:MFS transporter [Oscillospiraceae bacterium]